MIITIKENYLIGEEFTSRNSGSKVNSDVLKVDWVGGHVDNNKTIISSSATY